MKGPDESHESNETSIDGVEIVIVGGMLGEDVEADFNILQ